MWSKLLNFSHKAKDTDSHATSHSLHCPKNHNSHPVKETHSAQKQDDPSTNFSVMENTAIASKHGLKVLLNTPASQDSLGAAKPSCPGPSISAANKRHQPRVV